MREAVKVVAVSGVPYVHRDILITTKIVRHRDKEKSRDIP
jgi:hypothetical protein